MGATISSPYLLADKKINLEKNQNSNNNNQNESEFSLAENVYTPEAIFSSWLNLSFFSVTAAMIFYHLTQKKSIVGHPILIAMIAIGLIIISVSYVYFGIYPYYKRMTLAIDKCNLNQECVKNNINDIRKLRNEFTILGVGTMIVEILIAILIIWQSYKYL